MTRSWSSTGVPLRMPRSMNHRPSIASPPIIGTSKNVTSVLEPIVARYQLPHASTGKRDLYVKPIATKATLPDDARGSSASPPDKNCPLSTGSRSPTRKESCAGSARGVAIDIPTTPMTHAAAAMRDMVLRHTSTEADEFLLVGVVVGQDQPSRPDDRRVTLGAASPGP